MKLSSSSRASVSEAVTTYSIERARETISMVRAMGAAAPPRKYDDRRLRRSLALPT